MAIRIVGVSVSPVKAGNLDTFLHHIMTLTEDKGLETEIIHLAQLIHPAAWPPDRQGKPFTLQSVNGATTDLPEKYECYF